MILVNSKVTILRNQINDDKFEVKIYLIYYRKELKLRLAAKN